jgi:hypothetical protein
MGSGSGSGTPGGKAMAVTSAASVEPYQWWKVARGKAARSRRSAGTCGDSPAKRRPRSDGTESAAREGRAARRCSAVGTAYISVGCSSSK